MHINTLLTVHGGYDRVEDAQFFVGLSLHFRHGSKRGKIGAD